MAEKITYYAMIDEFTSRDNPRTVLRRVRNDEGTVDEIPRRVLKEHNLSEQHAMLLLEAFRRDVTKLRYANWDELMDYCRYSAMPVGRFVLDVHGESRATWAASDNVCAVLQIINHLQDCVKDYRALDRVYVPLDALAAAGSLRPPTTMGASCAWSSTAASLTARACSRPRRSS